MSMRRQGRKKGHKFVFCSYIYGAHSDRQMRSIFTCETCGIVVRQGNMIPKDECSMIIVKRVFNS